MFWTSASKYQKPKTTEPSLLYLFLEILYIKITSWRKNSPMCQLIIGLEIEATDDFIGSYNTCKFR